jgi:predicted DsbA family dithiol-disulfide isomerase
MASNPSVTASVRWRPFFLRPNHPAEGVAKAPDTPDNPRVGARMKSGGLAVGIDFTGLCDRYPNTLLAHCLLKYADEAGPAVQDKLSEILFRHYFTDGLYPDKTNLRKAAIEAGLADIEAAMKYVESAEAQQAVKAEAASFSRSGIRGVPFFFVNGQRAFSGAQPPEQFCKFFDSLL